MHLVIELSPRDVVDMFLFACFLALVWPMILIATFGLGKKDVAPIAKQAQSQPLSKPSMQDQTQ